MTGAPVWLPAVALGAGLGVGLWLIVLGLPYRRGISLDDRIAPYLGVDLPSRRGRRGWRGWSVLRTRWLEGLVTRLGSDPTSVRARLARAGDPTDLQQFRAQQVVCGLAGLALAGAPAAMVAGPGTGAVRAVLIVLLGGVLGLVARDQWLSRAVRRRAERIEAEFPAVAELLALSVAAGEGAAGALNRIVRAGTGPLCDELGQALGEARTGTPLAEALQELADRLAVPGLTVFVDGLVVAIERGTPLAEVLRAQAHDVRVNARRRLMEAGGRREIAMMVPVVFLVLPVTVLFAVYPGLAVLDLGL